MSRGWIAKATLVMGLAASALKRDRSSRDIAYTRKVPARRSRLLHGYVPLKSRDRIFLGVTAPQFSRHLLWKFYLELEGRSCDGGSLTPMRLHNPALW